MRVESQMKLPGDRLPLNKAENKSTDSFASAIKQSQANLQMETLNQLMTRIDAQGQKLAKYKTLENLRDYKSAVKQFVKESVEYGLQFSEKQSFHPYGGMKTHQLVEVIDQKLMELHDETLSKEQEGINTLSLIGEIKGLLINLYM